MRPGRWDHQVVTNPAGCLRPDGRVLLYYRANTPTGCKIGVAVADDPCGPFERLREDPILERDGDRDRGPVRVARRRAVPPDRQVP
ncbi:MAG: hypothetical protein ACOCYV_03315, partial [Planctomycetota bacterium]